MKSFLCFLAILLSTYNILAQRPSRSGEGAQNNRRGDYSNIDTCARSFDGMESGDVVPTLFNVTVSQYCDFLNAVAADDPHRLYDEQMGSDRERACIKRAGTPGNYTYSVSEGRGDLPITQVNLLNKERYCNWLENVQPIGSESPETTEDGVYTINNDEVVAVNSNTTYFLKSDENEFTIVSFCSSNPHLDVIPQLMMDPAIVEESFKKWILGESNPVDRTALLLPSPARDAVHIEDPEQREISKIFSQVALKTQDHYLTADALLPQVRSARDHRAAVQQAYQTKVESLEQAQKRFEKEKNELDNKDLNKTALGRVANAAAKASSITNVVNTPIVSLPGLFEGASTALDIVNRRWEKASFKKAKKDFESAEENAKAAEKELRFTGEAVDKIEFQRDKLEKEARDKELAEAKRAAITLKPLVLRFKESDWNDWATRIVSAAQLDSKWIVKIADRGRNNPTWASGKTATAWAERLRLVEEKIKNYEEQKKKDLQPLETDFNTAQAEAEQARATAYAAQERRDSMIQAEINAQEEYNEIQNLLRELELKKPKTVELAQTIKDTEKESITAYAVWEEAIQQRQAHEQTNKTLVKTTETAAIAAEEKALEC